MADPRLFALRLRMAQNNYNRTRDWHAYLADCVNIALQMGASELGSRDRRLAYLSYGVGAASGLVKGAVETFAHHMTDPLEAEQSHMDFLAEFAHYAKKHYGRDLGGATEVLRHLGLWSDD